MFLDNKAKHHHYHVSPEATEAMNYRPPKVWQSCHDQQDSSQRTSLLPDKPMMDATTTLTAHRVKYKKNTRYIWN